MSKGDQCESNDYEGMIRAREEARNDPSRQIKQDNPTPFPLLEDDLEDSLEYWVDKTEGKYRSVPLPKFPKLGKYLGGFTFPGIPPGPHALVGCPQSGKTALAVQIALDAAKAGHRVCYLSLELSTRELQARALSHHLPKLKERFHDHHLTRMPASALERADMPRSYIENEVKEASRELRGIPFHVVERGPRDIGGLVKSLNPEGEDKTALLIIDYIQILAAQHNHLGGDDLRRSMINLTNEITDALRDYQTAALLISSTSRSTYSALLDEKKEGTAPDRSVVLGSAQESNNIEFSSLSQMTLIRTRDGQTELHFGKNRPAYGDWQMKPITLEWTSNGFTELKEEEMRPVSKETRG